MQQFAQAIMVLALFPNVLSLKAIKVIYIGEINRAAALPLA